MLPVWGLGSGMNENVSTGAAGKAGMVKAMSFSLRVFKKAVHYKGMSKKKGESSSPSLALYLCSCRC